MMLTKAQILTLAKEVLAGKARSYVSAAHAFAEYLIDCEAETRVAVADEVTELPPQTLPLPFAEPSPLTVPDSDEVLPWDAAARRILEPKTTPHIGRMPLPFETPTGVRDVLPKTNTDGSVAPCAAHGVFKCVVCNRGGDAA